MAKYTLTHTCGHDQTHDLFGPHKERERKIAWLETTICTDCWKEEQRSIRKATPVTAEIIYNMFTGNTVYIAVTTGDTYAIKDALKSAGCRWLEYQNNDDILGISSPRKAWMIKIDPDDEIETAKIIQRLYDAGVTKIIDSTNPISAKLAMRMSA